MPGRYLLDANAAIAVLEEDQTLPGVAGQIEAYLSTAVLGELVFGSHKSVRTEANLERVRELAKLCPILVCDEETAYQYGWLKDQLRQKGQPIPENDLWIAATAVRYGLTLLTRDRHFDHFDGLDVLEKESW